MKFSPTRGRLPAWTFPGILALLLAGSGGPAAYAHETPYVVETELLSMNLSGGPFPLPLGQNFMTVGSHLQFMLNPNMRSVGQATIRGGSQGGVPSGGPDHFVDSFFDVFFDLRVTDVDPMNDYFGQSPGAVLQFQNPSNAPVHMTNQFFGTADPTKPNEGLLPPVGGTYLGHIPIEIPLGDLNGDSNPDFLRFTLVTHMVGDVTNTFIQGAQVFDTFNSSSTIEGNVNPPFGPFQLSGPTTATQQLVVPGVPEPASLVLLLGGGAGLWAWRRRQIAGSRPREVA